MDPSGVDYPDFDPSPLDAGLAIPSADGSTLLSDGAVVLPDGATAPVTTTPTVSDAGTRNDGGTLTLVDSAAPPSGSDAATSGDPEDAAVSGPSALECRFTARTDASGKLRYNGKYGCAVWVGDADSKLIKAFIVASRVASRTNLPAYRTASSGVTVDVVTGATLTAPMNHDYTWSTVDASGAILSDGTYTLNIETHSESGVDFVSVPFTKGASALDVPGGSDGDIKSSAVHCE